MRKLNNAQTIEKDLFLIHRTDICPVPEMKVGGTTVNLIFNRSTEMYEWNKRTSRPDPERMTLHWSFPDTKPNMELIRGDQGLPDLPLWENNYPKYIVIESMSTLKETIVGGMIDDLYTIGPYQLTHTATIIAPFEEVNSLSDLGFERQVIGYDSTSTNSEAVLDSFCKSKIKDLKISIAFPQTSIERISQIVRRAVDIFTRLKELPIGSEFCTILSMSDERKKEILPIELKRTATEFILTLPNTKFGSILRNMLTHASHNSTPGNIILSSDELEDSVEFKQLLPRAPWLNNYHGHSPFYQMEIALEQKDFDKVSDLFEEIKSHLDTESKVYANLIAFQTTVEHHYKVSLIKPPCINAASLFHYRKTTEAPHQAKQDIKLKITSV